MERERFPQINKQRKPNIITNGQFISEGNAVHPSATNVIVTGDGNNVGRGCYNISMLNSSGCIVTDSVHGVTLINTSGVIVSDNDLTYINGHLVTSSVFDKPCGMISDSTTQTLVDTTVGQVVTFDTNEHLNHITHSTSSNTSRVYIETSGTYIIAFEAHATSSSANQTMYFWLRIDAKDVARTTTDISLVNSNDSKSVTLIYLYTFSAGQFFEIVMGGTSTNCNIPASAAGVTPTRPASPSGILTIEMI